MKRIVMFLLLIISIMILISASALADTHTVLVTGEAGENVSWEVWENADGILTLEVSGSGPITQEINPYVEDSYINRIIVNEGVTSIGYNTISSFSSLTDISIPISVSRIDDGAFDECDTLTNVYYGGSKMTGSISLDVTRKFFSISPCIAAIRFRSAMAPAETI